MRNPVPALVPVSSETWLHERYQTVDIGAVVQGIRAQKRTGSVTINFTEGAVAGLEWREKKRCPVATVLPTGNTPT